MNLRDLRSCALARECTREGSVLAVAALRLRARQRRVRLRLTTAREDSWLGKGD